jgi:hypothetical protein
MNGFDLMRLNRKLDAILHNQRTLAEMIKLMAVSGTLLRSDNLEMETHLKHINERVADAQVSPPDTGAR